MLQTTLASETYSVPSNVKFKIAVGVLLVAIFAVMAQASKPLRVFIRAGEKTHGPGEHDYPAFLSDWTRLLSERGCVVEGALRFPTQKELARTDVLLLYAGDGGNIADNDRKNLETFMKRGGGLVVLHDGMCGTNASWFKTVAGGAKQHGETNWQRGTVGLYFSDYEHPVTRGVSNFDLDDELFFRLQLAPEAKIIGSTFRTAKEIVPQMWVFEKGKGRAFVSLQGHRYATFSHPAYRGLLLRGIAWAGKRNIDLLTRPDELTSFRYPPGGPTAPAEAVHKLQLQPDFDLSLVAAEPTVVNPISVDWDPRGRMWVAITPEYPFKQNRTPSKDAILILEDTNGDGGIDTRRVFADGLILPTSFVFHRDGVVVAQAPQILFLRDTNGDAKADQRDVLFSGFGTYDTHAVINNLRWGMDGWIYGCQGYSGNDSTNITNARGESFGKIGNGIFRFKPDGSAIEQVASYSGNSWGIDFSWDGELFYSMANGPHIAHVVMPERYLARGKIGDPTSGKSIGDHEKVFPIFTDPRHEYVQVSPVGVFTGTSGCMLYEGGVWPEKYHGSAFVCEPTVHIVHEDILTRSESPTYEATRRDEVEFLAGADLWFRPVQTQVGPDGAMYLLDFYSQAISHNDIRGVAHGPGNAALRPDRDHLHGRIYRIQHKAPRNYPAPDLAAASPEQLVSALEHRNAWVRLTAQRLLAERGDPGVVPALEAMLHTNRLIYAKVHALWTLHALDALWDTNLIAAISAEHPSLQNNALQLVAELRREPSTNVIAAVLKQLKDSSERTRLNALMALTQWPPGKETVTAVSKLFPDLKDDWSKSAVLGVARLAPTNFIRAAFASDKSESFKDLITPLAEDFLRARNDRASSWALQHLAKQNSSTDKLKIPLLEAYNKNLSEYAPPTSSDIERAIKQLLGAESKSVRVAAFPIALHYVKTGSLDVELEKARKALLAELTNEKAKEEDRNALLASLMSVPQLQPDIIAKSDAVLAKGASAAVQKKIIEEMRRTTNSAAASMLIKRFAALKSENKPIALGALLRRPDWTLALINAVATNAVTLTDLGVTGVNRLETYPDPRIAKTARNVIGRLRGPQSGEKEPLIDRFRTALEQPGNLDNGRELFLKNCAICHKFGDRGHELGPELTGVGLNGPEVLLTHILDPNRIVEGNFGLYNITTTKGEEYTGLIKTENKESVTLNNLEGEREIKRVDIASMTPAGRSLMPEGFEALGENGIRDIITYVASKTPKGFRALDMTSAYTADSRKGLYGTRDDPPSLAFKQFGIVMVDSIPFNIANPTTTPNGYNLTVLKGGEGFAKTLPQRVEFLAHVRAAKIYVLGGVGGWGFPYGDPEGYNVPVAKATLVYADGQKEEVVWKNGEQFADYVRPYEVPGSKAVSSLLTSGQLRWFSIVPKLQVEIRKIILESFNNHVAPTFVAMTAQVE
jgi:putative membrane-bound dehydrogenase-like protein